VKFSASLVFAALLLVSLAAKAALIAPAPDPDSRLVAREAAAMLRERGFLTAFERRPLGVLVHGRRGGCRLLVVDYNPYGTFAATIAARSAPVGPLRFAYRGELYRRAPKLVPLIDFYLYRELRRVGISARRHPIAAIASRGCDLAGFDWRRLSAFPD
jgi:hypothetical protein